MNDGNRNHRASDQRGQAPSKVVLPLARAAVADRPVARVVTRGKHGLRAGPKCDRRPAASISDRSKAERDGLVVRSPFPRRRWGTMQHFGNHASDHGDLKAASWFCLGLVFIAVVAGVVAVL